MRRRRRRTTTTQRIARVATVGMPYPVRAAFGTRLGSFLLVLGGPLLLVTGILTIEWDSRGPRFRFHRDRAAAIRQEAIETAREYQQQVANGQFTPYFAPSPAFGYDNRLNSPEPAGAVYPSDSLYPVPVPVPYQAPVPFEANPRYQDNSATRTFDPYGTTR